MIDDDAGDADTMVILSTTAHGHHDGVTTDLPYIYIYVSFFCSVPNGERRNGTTSSPLIICGLFDRCIYM